MFDTFTYRNGRFTKAPEIDGSDGGLDASGYSASQRVGDDCGLHYMLYAKGDDPHAESFVVRFGDAAYYCTILCESWPDLIGLLSKLSPIALAAGRLPQLYDESNASTLRGLHNSLS